MTVFEQWTSGSEATALPTEPQPLSLFSLNANAERMFDVLFCCLILKKLKMVFTYR